MEAVVYYVTAAVILLCARFKRLLVSAPHVRDLALFGLICIQCWSVAVLADKPRMLSLENCV